MSVTFKQANDDTAFDTIMQCTMGKVQVTLTNPTQPMPQVFLIKTYSYAGYLRNDYSFFKEDRLKYT